MDFFRQWECNRVGQKGDSVNQPGHFPRKLFHPDFHTDSDTYVRLGADAIYRECIIGRTASVKWTNSIVQLYKCSNINSNSK